MSQKFSSLPFWSAIAIPVASTAFIAAFGVTPSAIGQSAAPSTHNALSFVGCDYQHNSLNKSPSINMASMVQWRCVDGSRHLTANGIPDHEVGTFPNPNNPSAITAQTVSAKFPLNPSFTNHATELGGPRGAVGYILNGVKVDPSTNGGCNDSASECSMARSTGRWRMEALGQTSFKFGTDMNNAHVQPGGAYHYHGVPENFVAALGKGRAMTLIGWAADGFPIYARYGFTQAMDSASGIKEMRGSYRLKPSPESGRPPVSVYPMGTFTLDYDYVAGSGDLDECNGRFGSTPEFPLGTYHYFATDSYPYFQRCVKGAVAVEQQPRGDRPPQGNRGV